MLDSELAYYLGCYFSDGTKKRTWGICSSTLEQANFYLKMHKKIIYSPKIRFTLSYTRSKNEEINEYQLKKAWKLFSISNIYFREAIGSNTNKRNPFGTLIFKENDIGVLLAYMNILNESIKTILKTKNQDLALSFIGGVMEGDGGTNATNRGHIQITTNKQDHKMLEKVLEVARIKFKTVHEGGNKYYLRIGSIELTKNLDRIDLFILYPKRRKRLIERISKTGLWQALINNNYSGKSFFLLKEMRFIDPKTRKLTTKGNVIRKIILKMKREIC